MMKPTIKKRWLTALRSGKYEKGSGSLKYTSGVDHSIKHCALGVLYDILSERDKKRFKIIITDNFMFSEMDGGNIVPIELLKYLNIPRDKYTTIWQTNDANATFDSTINYIKENL